MKITKVKQCLVFTLIFFTLNCGHKTGLKLLKEETNKASKNQTKKKDQEKKQ